jgi:peroxiredoxin
VSKPDVNDATFEDGDAWHVLKSQNGKSLAELSKAGPVLVVFLRHAGCTFCREALADLKQKRSQIEPLGTRIVLVTMMDDASAAEFFEGYGLADVERFSDPAQSLYRAFGLELGSFGQLFGWKTWWRGFVAAVLHGHWFGRIRGNVFQMPGAFLVCDGKIVTSYRHRAASDRPDYAALACSTN